VSSFAPASAAPVFTKGCLSSAVDFKTLAADAHLDSEATAREHMAQVYERCTSISNFPESPMPGNQILLAATSDGYVGTEAIDVWRKHRPNMQVRNVHGGHVTAVALRSVEIRRAILDVLGHKDRGDL
jgi:thioesterase domain-containing protein